jgi:hypothetical protein
MTGPEALESPAKLKSKKEYKKEGGGSCSGISFLIDRKAGSLRA